MAVPEKGHIICGKQAPLRKVQPRIGKFFLDILGKYHNLLALIDADKDEEISFGELKEKSIRLALWLRKQGIKKGDAITLIGDIRLEAPIFFLSALYEGIIFIPWVPIVTLESARHKLKITHPKVIFSTLQGLDIIKESCELEGQNPIIIALDADPGTLSLEDILDSIPQSAIETYEPIIIDNLDKDVSMIFFTSGSTGVPKGAAHSFLSVINNFIRLGHITHPNQTGRPITLSYLPPAFTVWYLCFITGMHEGGVHILHRNFDPVQTTKLIKKYQVNSYCIMSHEIAQYVQSGILNTLTTDLSSVRTFNTGSSVINSVIFDTFIRKVEAHAIVHSIYGLTESGYGLIITQDYKTRSNTTADPMGFVEPNVQIKIVDYKTGKIAAPYKYGEIFIKLPYMFLGYYNNTEETIKAIDGEGWLHSGDIAYYDEKDELFYVARIKDLIKYKEFDVAGSFIEEELLKNPDVLEACVVAVIDIYDGEHPMAFVVKQTGSNVTEADLIKLSSTLGDEYTLRGGVVFLDAFPRLPNTKVDKVQLKQMAKAYQRKYE